MPEKDIREITVAELCDLAGQLRNGEPGSPAHRRACDRMALASWYLEHSGVFYCMGLEPVAPPGFEPGPGPDPPPSPGSERTATILTMRK